MGAVAKHSHWNSADRVRGAVSPTWVALARDCPCDVLRLARGDRQRQRLDYPGMSACQSSGLLEESGSLGPVGIFPL